MGGVIEVAELETELRTFEAHRQELLGSSSGKFVLIHGDEIAGTYESELDAVDEGYRRFGNVAFLVKCVTEVDPPINFVSGLVLL